MLSFYLTMIDDSEDKSKFEYLVLKYERQLFYIAYRIIKDKGLAEDAVQITLFNLAKDFKKISDLNENILKARLYIMVKNASINIHIKKNRQKEVFFEDNEQPIYKPAIDIESIVASRLEYAKLIDTINELPEHYREVLYLEQVGGCSIKEIADIMGLKYDTVQKRLKRAKLILQEKLTEREVLL